MSCSPLVRASACSVSRSDARSRAAAAKAVTTVPDVRLYDAATKALASRLKKRCGCDPLMLAKVVAASIAFCRAGAVGEVTVEPVELGLALALRATLGGLLVELRGLRG